VSTVFGHGRLRLYLLKLLAESPRHGYEVISLLEDRFMGTYAPSPGTVYPRLQRLEAEGLVTHSQEGGRKVYRITDAGREELDRRQEELADLEADIRSSVRGLARQIRDEVRGTVRDLRQELKQAAREMRREQRHENRYRREHHGEHWAGHWSGSQAEDWSGPGWTEDCDGPSAKALEQRLQRFLDRTHRLAHRVQLTESQVRECASILDEAFDRIRATLRQQR
jgi:DNA-binding PadR family transcriptional regulator